MSETPDFSIDLQSELTKISQRQYLNRVHHLIGLVRYALTHRPNRIEIRSKGKKLTFVQDGGPPEAEELELLETLLGDPRADQDPRQEALSTLETIYGVTLLSLFFHADRLKMETRDRCIQVADGPPRFLSGNSDVAGFRIDMDRRESASKQELRELTYYCAGADVPIIYNGKTINQPIQLDNQILTLAFSDERGQGVVGIPMEGDSSRFSFYKSGVRLGVKQFDPDGSRTLQGYWNASILHFEADYRQTIGDGETRLLGYGKQLYKAIPKHFSQMDPQRRARLKTLLLSLSDKKWVPRYGTIPLFNTYARPYAVTAADLIRMKNRYGAVIYRRRADLEVPAHIPILGPDDLIFIRNHLKLPTRMLTQPPRGNPYTRRPHPPLTTAEPEAVSAAEPVKVLLTALNRLEPLTQFRLSDTRPRMEQSASGLTTWFLPTDHPLLQEAANAYQTRPEQLPLYRYRLTQTVAF